MRLFAVCLALLVAAACGNDEAQTPVDATPAIDASLEPALSVTANPTTIAPGGTVTLTVMTTNFNIVNPMTATAVRPGEGHYHYYLDDANDYVAAWSPTKNVRTATNIAPGDHTIRLVLVASNHEEISPPVSATVTFTVQ